MNWGFFTRVVLGIALVVGVFALGAGVYQAGFTAGVATEGTVAVAPAPVYAGYGWGVHWGFPFFGFFGFLLFLFLLFGLFRLDLLGRSRPRSGLRLRPGLGLRASGSRSGAGWFGRRRAPRR